MSALRTIRQLTVRSRSLHLASAPVVRHSSLARRIALPVFARAVSASARSLTNTPANTQLANKLREELEYENAQHSESGSTHPEFLTSFQQQGVWEILDTPGNDEVFLTRKFGDENIRVMFSIADLHDFDAEFDDEEPTEAGAAKEAPLELRVSLSITKTTVPGALNVDLYCTDGAFQPATVSFYKDSKIGTELSIESDFARRTLFTGPPFETLDVGLQENMEAFLRERGIDETLARFVPEYATYKEQTEYVQWLEAVGKFVDT
ncbi:mitochondrial glycoprotein [Mycena pura]|uniref:Mitochondrial glycoprotein n=1 Tax=Mycena pura TaxID=153505 RepID=A0AAD6US84_9AGAR|nr:mitochondrial glycoprotein [Mycena pura]